MKCIIIEDEAGSRTHLEKQLKRSGFDVEVIARLDTVGSAILWLQQYTTDLIFMDISLGDGYSFEILDKIRTLTPVIFTTAYNKEYAYKAKEAHALAYLLKPVKRTELINALEKNAKLFEKRPAIAKT